MENLEEKRQRVTKHAQQHKHPQLSTPAEMKRCLDPYVIGQEGAKQTLTVAMYEHLQALTAYDAHHHQPDFVPLPKNNILLFGPTGCGKTYLLKRISQLIKVPFLTVNAPAYVPTGYKGTNLEYILTELVVKAGDVQTAERSVIFLDELDKRAIRPGMSSSDAAFNAEFQHDLLKMVEGATYEVNGENLDTTNILFVLGGAFVGLDQVVKERLQKENPSLVKHLGFTAPLVVGGSAAKKVVPGQTDTTPQQEKPQAAISDPLSHVTPEDLVQYGIITELTGRLPVLCRLLRLTIPELELMLLKGRECILRGYECLFDAMNVELTFTTDAIKAVAEKTYVRKMGARALNTILEHLLAPFIYNHQADGARHNLTITGAYVQGRDQGQTQPDLAGTPIVEGRDQGQTQPILAKTSTVEMLKVIDKERQV